MQLFSGKRSEQEKIIFFEVIANAGRIKKSGILVQLLIWHTLLALEMSEPHLINTGNSTVQLSQNAVPIPQDFFTSDIYKWYDTLVRCTFINHAIVIWQYVAQKFLRCWIRKVYLMSEPPQMANSLYYKPYPEVHIM